MKLTLAIAATLLVCVNAKFGKTNRGDGQPGWSFEEGATDASIVRQLIHESDYIALGTKVLNWPGLEQYPSSICQLVVDGSKDESTGVPFFYLRKDDPTLLDIKLTNKTSVLLTEGVIKNRCDKFPLGIVDYACPRALLLGIFEHVPLTEEGLKAFHWFVEKYPAISLLDPTDYQLWKLNIEKIFIGHNGVPVEVSKEDYLKATPAKWIDE